MVAHPPTAKANAVTTKKVYRPKELQIGAALVEGETSQAPARNRDLAMRSDPVAQKKMTDETRSGEPNPTKKQDEEMSENQEANNGDTQHSVSKDEHEVYKEALDNNSEVIPDMAPEQDNAASQVEQE